MMKYLLPTFLSLLLIFTFSHCGEAGKKDTGSIADSGDKKDSSKVDKKEKPDEEKEKKRPFDRKYNDIARLIAGLPADSGSVLEKYHQDPAWINYSNVAKTQWQNVTDVKIPIMKKWREEELKATNQINGTLFYPFSGPDFLHANTFFPSPKKIVMIGLEPIGNMPDFDKISQKGMLNSYFLGVQNSLATILAYSFFRTLSMQVDLTGQVSPDVDGTLHLILLFMARTNQKIMYYEKVALTPEGKEILASEVQVPAGKRDDTYYGTRIDYMSPGDPERKILYYFSVNLSDEPYLNLAGFSQRKDLTSFLESLDITATYLKSASYLMYNSSFNSIRNFILRKSQFVLQDDSGMAFSNFTDGKWDVTLFGRYVGPISLFANRWQQDMANAYNTAKDNLRPLPFGIGYQYAEGTSNLILAKKK